MTSTINGNQKNNRLTGTGASERLNGFGGNDQLYGLAGGDTLDGGDGRDSMAGGSGNDLYLVDSIADVVVESPFGGADTVQSSVSYALYRNVENLVLTGGAMIGIGNGLDNAITGNDARNALFGNDGDDVLDGGAGNDTLKGGDGNDALKGGPGSDWMGGGEGNDTYEVDASGDRVIEAFGNGTDTVLSSLESYTLGDHVERLTIVGDGRHGTGNSLDNKLAGNGGANRLAGLGGNDVLLGGGGADSLSGGSGNDFLDGGAGGDTILGGAGFDTIAWDADDAKVDGGDGLDTLAVDGGDAIDLTAVAGGMLTGVEVLDLRGDGDNVITLDAGAIDALVDGNTLTIKGDAGDRVTATDAWEHSATTPEGYEVYTHGDVVLRIRGGVEFVSGGGSGNQDPGILEGGNEDAIVEDTDVTEGHLTAGGTIPFSDDQSEGHSATFEAVQNELGGTLALEVTSPVGEAPGAIAWTYTVDNAAVQHLGAGDTAEEVFSVLLSDGNGGQDEQTVTVTVTGVNDAAAIGGTDTGSVAEDGTLIASGVLTVNDADTGESAFTAASGQASDNGWGTWSIDADGNWDYAATNAAIQALGEGATDTFSVTSADGTTHQVTIDIGRANDAPVNSVPGAQSVDEDGLLVFSSGNGNALEVSDPDGDGAELEVTLTADHGVLSLGGTAGLAFSSGDGSGDSTMTFTGSASDINAALAGLAYDPDSDFNGSAQISIDTGDQGNFGDGGALSDSDAIQVTVNAVNDAPSSADNTVAVPDNGNAAVYTFSTGDFGFSDVDGDSLQGVKVIALPSAADGELRLNGSAVSAGQAIAADDIDQLTFTQAVGASDGAGTFTFQVRDDSGEAGDLSATQTMTVTLLGGDYVGSAAGNTYAAGSEGERIRGLGGDDSLTGGAGEDSIFGGTGLDTLTGGAGGDALDAGAGDGASDTVVYNDVFSDGAAAGAATGFDFIQGFLAGNDLIRFEGDAAAAIDEGVDSVISFVTNGTGVDFSGDTEAVLLTNAGLADADLVAPGYANLRAVLDTALADTSAAEDGLVVVRGATDTGVYFFFEDGTAGIAASEIRLLAVIDNALLGTASFQIDTPID